MAAGHRSETRPETGLSHRRSIGGGARVTPAPPREPRPPHVTGARSRAGLPRTAISLPRRPQDGRLLASLALLNGEIFIVPFGQECSCPLWRCQ